MLQRNLLKCPLIVPYTARMSKSIDELEWQGWGIHIYYCSENNALKIKLKKKSNEQQKENNLIASLILGRVLSFLHLDRK